MSIEEVVQSLQAEASEKFKGNIVKLGIPEEKTFGVSTTKLRALAKKLPKDSAFLLELWATGYHECKILSVLAFNPSELTDEKVDYLMNDIESWDLCDLFCKTILIKKPTYADYIYRWIGEERLYYKRAAFTLIASTSTHTSLTDEEVKTYLELIDLYADDDRPLIKKAASWALRELGKINERYKEQSIQLAKKMKNQDSNHKQWIAKDALKELSLLVKVDGRTRLISSKSKMGQNNHPFLSKNNHN